MAKFIYLSAEKLYLNPDYIVNATIIGDEVGNRVIELVTSDGKVEGFEGPTAEKLIQSLNGLLS